MSVSLQSAIELTYLFLVILMTNSICALRTLIIVSILSRLFQIIINNIICH